VAHIYCEDVFGIVGETFTFPVEINQKISEIIWKKSKDKVAVWDGQSTPTYFTSLRNRSILKENGCLTIFNLEKSDAGAYELDYWDSKMDHYLYFELTVLDPPAEPKIGCSIRGDNLVLNCTSDFPRPLNYTWKFRKNPLTYHSQEISIPIENDDTENATCLIAFSQTEKSSEISLIQCFP
ncbi:LFA3 protein, partial [Smithornis capensis]|nr:LFA3 protein [Smithornis capensis]